MLIDIWVNAFEIRMWPGNNTLHLDGCLWKVFSGSGTRSVKHIFSTLIRWALFKHEWGCAISHPAWRTLKSLIIPFLYPNSVLFSFCLLWSWGLCLSLGGRSRYETVRNVGLSWLTGPTHIPKMRYSPGQTRALRGRPFKDDQRRVTVLNSVAKHDSPPLLKNITL